LGSANAELVLAFCYRYNLFIRQGGYLGEKLMKQYKLPVIIQQPNAETENKYLAEIPLLKGCRAWGDTPEESLDNLRSVASEFIRSFKEHGQDLPKAIEETAYELVGPKVPAELTIYL
jgi:predicted RNase H-like HicB family nuclease